MHVPKTYPIETYTKKGKCKYFPLNWKNEKQKEKEERKQEIISQDSKTPRTAIFYRHQDIINFI